MKNYITIICLLAGSLFSCSVKSQPKPDNTKPMYGEVSKDERYKQVDDNFRKASLEQFQTIDNAIDTYLYDAWSLFYHNDLETAMKRFNQVWLLNPEYPDAYFGFAALLEVQGQSKEAQRFYQLAEKKDTGGERAAVCLQKIADCKENLERLQKKN